MLLRSCSCSPILNPAHSLIFLKDLIAEYSLEPSQGSPCFGVRSDFVYVAYKALHDLTLDGLSGCLTSYTVCLFHVEFIFVCCTDSPPLPWPSHMLSFVPGCTLTSPLEDAFSGPHVLLWPFMHTCICLPHPHQTMGAMSAGTAVLVLPALGVEQTMCPRMAVVLASSFSALLGL